MAESRMTAAAAGVLRLALADPRTIARYQAKLADVPGLSCSTLWTGALAPRGHGRLWLAREPDGTRRGYAVIAHRYGYGLHHGYDALMATEVIAHGCDNPLCQTPEHWVASTHAANRRDWAARRHHLTGPLRDLRGARGRALAIRDAVRTGQPLPAILAAGISPVDRDQLALFDDPTGTESQAARGSR